MLKINRINGDLYVNGIKFRSNASGVEVPLDDIGKIDGAYYPAQLNKRCKHGYHLPNTVAILAELISEQPTRYLFSSHSSDTLPPCVYCKASE